MSTRFTMVSRPLRFAALCTLAFAGAFAEEKASEVKPPDRREMWVPADKLPLLLDEKAVLLTRAQYEALLREAGVEKPEKREAPAGAVMSGAIFRAAPNGKTVTITAELILNVLRDGWTEVPLDLNGAAIAGVKLDGEGVLLPRNTPLRAGNPPPVPQAQGKASPPALPTLLLVRGQGEHRVSLDLTAPIRTAAGINTFALTVPNVASGTFTLALPAGATMEKSGLAMKVNTAPEATIATLALSPAHRTVLFAWKNAAASAAPQPPVNAQVRANYWIDAEKIAALIRFRFDSTLGDLPEAFEFSLPPEVKVLAVRADELRGWEAAGGKVTANFQTGARKTVELDIDAELPSLAGKDAATAQLPIPLPNGVARLDGLLGVNGRDDVIVKDVALSPGVLRVPTSEDRGVRGFYGVFGVAGRTPLVRVTLDRALPRMEVDLDTLVEFRSDAIYLTRNFTLREENRRRFSAAIAIPAAEELLDVRRIEEDKTECEPEWAMEAGRVVIRWTDETAKFKTFRLRSRVEPEQWTQMPAGGVTFALGDVKISDAAKVAGYIALVADPAFRLEAQPGETLERRDGRNTPVRGEYAWFRRDVFDLKVKVARRPAEVLAALTGYVLPLEGVLDVHASMNYQFMGGGTRSVRIRVPKDLAQNFHFDGPQIAERALEGDVWTVTFQKELTGGYALGITVQVPVAKQAGEGSGYSFAVKVPVISPLDVVRASGLWAVEANTETEITFDARGMNELDSLLAPQIEGYVPRHRVIGVFGWLGTEYTLGLKGVRHAAAGMLTAVVDSLMLTTVASTSGLHRHEARYHLRASGVEYLDVALPAGAKLLSVALDGVAVKPVADRPGSVRLPLPARRDNDSAVVASLVYETPADAWKGRGTLALVAPAIAKEIPVLKSTWRVWVPEGFSFTEFDSNLPVPEVVPERLLAFTLPAKLGEVAFGGFLRSRKRSQATAILEDLRVLDSKVDQLAVEKGERPVGAPAPMAPAESDDRIQKMTVPAPDAKPFTGLEAKRDLSKLSSEELKALVSNSEKSLNNFEGLMKDLDGLARNGDENAKRLAQDLGKKLQDQAGVKVPGKPTFWEQQPGKIVDLNEPVSVPARKTAGLLPVTLDLPTSGRALLFEGLYAPERLTMRYDDWWGRARSLWIWFVAGAIAVQFLAGRWPCWRTLWAILLLSAVPLCLSITWMPVCNALLGGWLAGVVLNRIAAWCIFRKPREVLA